MIPIVRASLPAALVVAGCGLIQPAPPAAHPPPLPRAGAPAPAGAQPPLATKSPQPVEERIESKPAQPAGPIESKPVQPDEPKPAQAAAAKPPPAARKAPAPAAKPSPAPAAAKPPPPAVAAKPAPPPLDLGALEQRLKATEAIGVLTKLSLKNQVDDLLARFRSFHEGRRPPTLSELRPSFELLLMKVLSLLQDKDEKLARDIDASREALWSVLADREKLGKYF